MSSNNWNPNNSANGPDYEDVDSWWDRGSQSRNFQRPRAATWEHDWEDIPKDMLDSFIKQCIVRMTCPGCGNSAFYFNLPYGHSDRECVVDGCDVVLKLD